ncbi:unnamed protein product, partial [Nesidiocoris tenuis]
MLLRHRKTEIPKHGTVRVSGKCSQRTSARSSARPPHHDAQLAHHTAEQPTGGLPLLSLPSGAVVLAAPAPRTWRRDRGHCCRLVAHQRGHPSIQA